MVLCQSLPEADAKQGPDFYAVLVPREEDAFACVARRLKITPIYGEALGYSSFSFSFLRWHRFQPKKRLWVPECQVEGMRGGESGPKQITKWKIDAIKLCLIGVKRGYLTGKDFKDFGFSMTRWRTNRWIHVAAEKVQHEGRMVNKYLLVLENNPPHLKFPEITESLKKAGLV